MILTHLTFALLYITVILIILFYSFICVVSLLYFLFFASASGFFELFYRFCLFVLHRTVLFVIVCSLARQYTPPLHF